MPAARSLIAAAVLAAATQTLADEREPDVGFIVTPERVLAAMLDMAAVGPDDLVVDLGAGDGRIPIAAARDYGAAGWGVEIDAALVEESRRLAEAAGVAGQVHFTHGDIFEVDFSAADVVALYLLPALNRRLKPAILALPPGTRVVSHEFGMGDWPPDQSASVGRHPIHLWIVPASLDGDWLIDDGERQIRLSFDQDFQRFEGRARPRDGDWQPIRNGRIEGGHFTFSLQLDGEWQAFRGTASAKGVETLESAPALSGSRLPTHWKMQRREQP